MASILSDSGTLTTPAIPTPAGVTPKPCHSDARERQRQQPRKLCHSDARERQRARRNLLFPTTVIPTPASASEPGGICFSPPPGEDSIRLRAFHILRVTSALSFHS